MKRKLVIIFWASLIAVWVGLWLYEIHDIYQQPTAKAAKRPGE